ncbi:MAG: tRNA pseudouridine(55) synthase TruB [Candidatus Symbiothrix sp.]|nr:tRNA pseudouridine(55) synthase TruB [Candidatus Symbiothrix sp.]
MVEGVAGHARNDRTVDEVLYFDKPLNWTSFDLVNKLRYKLSRQLGIKKLKVGHAGTLDPLATGVMIVCVGKATKRIDEFQYQTKEYVATLRLGETTPSFDLETEVDKTYETAHITRELIEKTLPTFLGEIQQLPPAYSACKVNGNRAYDLARKGLEVDLKPKMLVIDEIELLEFHQGIAGQTRNENPVGATLAVARNDNPAGMTIRVVCSKGTYIRALARDIGATLGSGAFLTGLVRTRIGDVTLDKCLKIEDIDKLEIQI